MNLQFQDPHFLWLLIGVPVLAWLFSSKGKNPSILFPNTEIIKQVAKSNKSRAGKFFLTLKLLALSLIIVAFARPQWGKGESYAQASGIDIVLAVDISGSMMALDFASKTEIITRLDTAKDVIKDFIEKRPNDRISLIAFSKNPYLVSPLTLNHDWLESNLKRMQVGLVPDGTAIGNAIAMGVNRLKDLKSKSKVIILLTDGVSNAGNISPIAAAEAAAAFEIKVYTVAVGKGGVVKTVGLGADGKPMKNAFGDPIIGVAEIPVDLETLSIISEKTDAKSFHASNKDELKDIYNEINSLEKTEVKFKHYSNYDEVFATPLVGALALLLLEFLLTRTYFRRLP